MSGDRARAWRMLAVAPCVAAALAGCAAGQPGWLRAEDEECFRPRRFSEEIPSAYWGDPLRDPCWRYRPFVSDR
jgi:hypothetical protein